MLLEKIFANLYGVISLISLMVILLGIMMWVLLKKDTNNRQDNVLIKEEKEETVSVTDTTKEETVIETPDVQQEKGIIANVNCDIVNTEYEIVESEDGFYRVKKVGNDRTLRKFSTRIEAENYIEKRGLTNDR